VNAAVIPIGPPPSVCRYAKDATEIQNIQIGEGDVCRGAAIPLYMIFPRLFTCPTLATDNFKVGKSSLTHLALWRSLLLAVRTHSFLYFLHARARQPAD